MADQTSKIQGAVIFASVPSCLTWDNVPSSHWSTRGLFYSSIVFALVAIVSGAQQQMVLPSNDVKIEDVYLDGLVDQLTKGNSVGSTEASKKKNGKSRRGRNHRLIFALQLPLMIFSLAVAAFLGGLLGVVFGPLGSSQRGTDDERKVCDKIRRSQTRHANRDVDCRALWDNRHIPDSHLFWLLSLGLSDSTDEARSSHCGIMIFRGMAKDGSFL